MTITTDYQVQFGGVVIADADRRVVLSLSPFDSPDIRSTDYNRGQQDGMFPGEDLYAGRTIMIELELWGETDVEFYDAYRQVLNACTKGPERELEFKLPGWTDSLVVDARCRKVSGLIVDQSFDLAVGRCVLQFFSTDPRMYSSVETATTVGFEGSQTGRSYNLSFNRVYGAIVTSNVVAATNNGNYDAPWVARIDGPVTNPIIENSDTGETIQLIGTVPVGQFLEVASEPYQTIMLDGTATRYSWLASASQWFMLKPGLNNIRFRGTSTGTPTMTFTWRSAWV